MQVFGIDPGGNGCIALIDAGRSAYINLKDATEHDVCEWLRDYVVDESKCHAFIERVHSSPQMGVCSAFSFGKSYGFLLGIFVASRIPFEEVPPQKWQKAMGCMTQGDKNKSKARAQQLFAPMKITHANADALLIAEYGRRELMQRNGIHAC